MIHWLGIHHRECITQQWVMAFWRNACSSRATVYLSSPSPALKAWKFHELSLVVSSCCKAEGARLRCVWSNDNGSGTGGRHPSGRKFAGMHTLTSSMAPSHSGGRATANPFKGTTTFRAGLCPLLQPRHCHACQSSLTHRHRGTFTSLGKTSLHPVKLTAKNYHSGQTPCLVH